MTHRRRRQHAGSGALLRRPAALRASLLLAIVGACLAIASAASAAPGDVVWRDFSQRVAGGHDAYRALVVTPGGNAYVAGSTTPNPGAGLDVLVRKFSPGGKVLWQRTWAYPGRGDGLGSDMARDRRGNVIVAGSSGSSWLLLKYGADGYLEWVRHGRKPYARCELTAVTVDGAGSIYATGVATPAGLARRFFTIKYSPTGAFLWRTTLGSIAGDATGGDIVSGGGDVYVTGVFATGPETRKAAVIKYSSAGKRRWSKFYAAAPGDSARGLAVAYRSGVLVMGVGTAPGEQPDGFVVRYSPAGAEEWVATYAGAYDLGDRFNAMVVDASGRTCVTGSRWTGGADEMITLRFTALGVLEWEHALTSAAGQGSAVCRAGGGAYYSAGGTLGAVTSQDTASGLPGWQQTIAPAGYNGFHPAAVQAAGASAVYVAGWTSPDAGGEAAMLVRYRP